MKLKLDADTLKLIDTEYDLMVMNADADVIEKSKRELGQMETILGHDDTIKSLVDDILDHYENYRENLLTGKAMIVAYSRAIAMKIAIVVDMWLTGFDVPSLATMYVYKPMMGYNLMQAIARVNRVFRDKEGGLVVDYVGIAGALKRAMNDYTIRDKKNYGNTDIAKVAYPKFQ